MNYTLLAFRVLALAGALYLTANAFVGMALTIIAANRRAMKLAYNVNARFTFRWAALMWVIFYLLNQNY
jgi:hypothetical protein